MLLHVRAAVPEHVADNAGASRETKDAAAPGTDTTAACVADPLAWVSTP